MKNRRWAKPAQPALTATEAKLLAEVGPRLERLAEDSWVLAQRAPSLVADPALVEAAARLLPEVRKLLRREPGRRLIPENFAAAIGLHALALSLRQLQLAVAAFAARRRSGAAPGGGPGSGPGTGEQIDAINSITALVLRDMASDLAERRKLQLPQGLRRLKK